MRKLLWADQDRRSNWGMVSPSDLTHQYYSTSSTSTSTSTSTTSRSGQLVKMRHGATFWFDRLVLEPPVSLVLVPPGAPVLVPVPIAPVLVPVPPVQVLVQVPQVLVPRYHKYRYRYHQYHKYRYGTTSRSGQAVKLRQGVTFWSDPPLEITQYPPVRITPSCSSV